MPITFKTVGGYEVITDGEDTVSHHRLLACLDNDPNEVFDSRYMNTHHRNTIPWDNRPQNLLLWRSRYHRNFHGNTRWSELCDFYNENSIDDSHLRLEKYYDTLTEKSR